MRWWLASLVVLGFAASAGAQGGLGSAPSTGQLEASTPGRPVGGQIWIRKSDLRVFVYSDSLGKWLGEETIIQTGRNNANHTGQLRFGEVGGNQGVPYQGFDVSVDSLRIMEVTAKSYDVSTTAACTTFVFSDADTILKLIWDANEERWTPGGSGWVSAAPRVAIAPGKTLSATIGAGGSVLPDFPLVWFYVRREVTPS